MSTKNISFKFDEQDYEAIKKFAKEKRQKNLKGYIICLAKQDMKQHEFEITNDDTYVEQIKKLTREILHELIDEIKINHTKKLDSGKTVQIITIYWNCIGAIEIPDFSKIPDVDVTVNTRKGIKVKYAPKLSA